MDANGPNVLQKTTSDNVTITNGVGGIFQVALDDSDTAGLAQRKHLHQAIVTFANGDVVVVSEGAATILGQIVVAA